MRALLCMYDYFAGGAETQFRYLAEGLMRNENIELCILFEQLDHDGLGHSVEQLRKMGVKYYNLNIKQNRGLIGRIALKLHYNYVEKLIEKKLNSIFTQEGQFDWVITYNYTFIPFIDLFHKWNAKVLFSERNDGRWIQKLGKVNYGVRKADKVTCNSASACEFINKTIGIECEYIKNGILIDKDKFEEKEKTSGPILISARISPEKNQKLVIEALADDDVRTDLILCGGISDKDYYETLLTVSQKNGLSNKIHFMGFQNDMIPYYHSAYCVVLPSLYEGTPNSILEAYSLGIPVLASRISMNIPLFEDDNLLFSPEDPSEFVKAYSYLKKMSKDDLHKLIWRNHEFVQQEYGIEKMQNSYLRILTK